MKTIHKYSCSASTEMPIGATILKVGVQDHGVYLWALVDTDAAYEIRCFIAVGTGDALDENRVHVGTVFEDSFVWHIMEVVND